MKLPKHQNMVPDKQAFHDLKRALQNQGLLQRELRNNTNRALYKLNNLLFKYYFGHPSKVTNDDWDNLIILDACRFDIFSEENEIGGELKKSITDSHSWAFLERNFVGDRLHDTVYITGNAHAPKIEDNVFHYMKNVKIRGVTDDQSYPGPPIEDLKVVRPEDVVAVSQDAHERFPNKRLIIHFMQPHLPFLGSFANEKYQEILDTAGEEFISTGRWGENIDIWSAVRSENTAVNEEDLEEMYRENLRIVLDEVKKLNNSLNGKSVITSDHGQLLGEVVLGKRQFGHPHHIRTRNLCVVPWLEILSEKRKQIEADPPVKSVRLSEAEINEQLQALGYK